MGQKSERLRRRHYKHLLPPKGGGSRGYLKPKRIRTLLVHPVPVLFDLGADVLGMVVPGGSIAVKLTKAAIDGTMKDK
jgi:hypothetical protein